LRQHGHEVAFFSMHHSSNKETQWEKYFIENIDYHKQYTIQKRFELVGKILWNFEAQHRLGSLLKAFRPDIAHLHNIYHQLSPSIIATLKKQGVPMVMTLHDYKLLSPNYSLYVRGKIWEGGAFRCIRDRCVRDAFVPSGVCSLEHTLHSFLGIYKNVDVFLSPSLFLKELFEKKGFQGKIKSISQPLILQSTQQEENLRGEHLLYAGRLSREKGVDTLLSALVYLPTCTVRIAGEGPEKNNLYTLAHNLGVVDRVTFLGHLSSEKLKKELCFAKAVIIPSVWYENMPYALLEALGAGQIVIASKIGGMTEKIIHRENGFLFEAGNVKDLVSVLSQLNAYDLDSMRKRAKESVVSLTQEQYYRNLFTVYQEVLKKKK
ncbi:MAG: glycosyltransferase, partial [Candidatus Moranbacteria bacterium]|nr:glycosyltransferase [Candidatus Moranbacteria bacterium]